MRMQHDFALFFLFFLKSNQIKSNLLNCALEKDETAAQHLFFPDDSLCFCNVLLCLFQFCEFVLFCSSRTLILPLSEA